MGRSFVTTGRMVMMRSIGYMLQTVQPWFSVFAVFFLLKNHLLYFSADGDGTREHLESVLLWEIQSLGCIIVRIESAHFTELLSIVRLRLERNLEARSGRDGTICQRIPPLFWAPSLLPLELQLHRAFLQFLGFKHGISNHKYNNWFRKC